VVWKRLADEGLAVRLSKRRWQPTGKVPKAALAAARGR
jgi:hypothetical protein